MPFDPFYLYWKAKQFGVNAHFIELSGEINTNMPYYVISRMQEALNNHNKCIKNSNILIIGVSYKPNVDDTNDSPAFKIWKLLEEMGANISYYDPYVKQFNGCNSIRLLSTNIEKSDCILILTDHTNVHHPHDWR